MRVGGNAGPQRDRILGATDLARPTLHAIRLDEQQLRYRCRFSDKRGRRAQIHACVAERAGIAIEIDSAERNRRGSGALARAMRVFVHVEALVPNLR